MSMATRSSDLGDQKPGVNIQTKGHPLHCQVARMALKIKRHLVVPHCVYHPSLFSGKETDTWLAWDSVLFENTGDLDQRLKSDTTTPHAWQVPVVEEMVWDGKFGLTEAVVTGPDWAILFYRQRSLGEGLSLHKAWDAVFTLSGAISSVGKQAQPSSSPVSLGEGWWLIAQAITKGCIKPRGLGCPRSIPSVSTQFKFHNQDSSPWPASLPTAVEWWEVPKLGPRPVYHEWGWAPQWGQDSGWGQKELWAAPPHHLCPHQIMDSKMIKVQHQPPHQCLQGPRDREVVGIQTVANGPTIWRHYEDQAASLQGWGHKRCHHIPKLALGLNRWSLCGVPGLHPSPLCYLFSARLPGGVGEKLGDRHHLGWHTHHTGWAL